MSIVTIAAKVKAGISLTTALEDEGLEGADFNHWQALINNYNSSKPRKTTRRNSGGKGSKKSNYAKMQSAISMATLELVKRVNEETNNE